MMLRGRGRPKVYMSRGDVMKILRPMLLDNKQLIAQNARLNDKLNSIIQSRRHYLRHRAPYLKNKKYQVEGIQMMYSKLETFKKQIGAFPISSRPTKQKLYFVRLTKNQIIRLRRNLQERDIPFLSIGNYKLLTDLFKFARKMRMGR